MHEYSVVQNLLDIVENNASRHNAKAVKEVVVKIGVLSGIEPQLLKIAFDTFKENTICEKALLKIQIQPLFIECSKCGFKGNIQNTTFLCPLCKNPKIKILDGEEMYLMQIEMEQ